MAADSGCHAGKRNGAGVTVREIVKKAIKQLEKAGVEDARQDAWLLLAHVVRRGRAALIAHARDDVEPEHRRTFQRLVARRANREPFAQIVGKKEFWSLEFQITGDVLCPRPDSETLIEAALAEVRMRWPLHRRDVRILDLGTGSGCLLLSLLAELRQATGIGVDISAKALAVALANAERLGLAERAAWVRSSWASALDGHFDLIVCNPPYIALNARPELAPEVEMFEPSLALFAGDDGLDCYRMLAKDLHRLTAPDGIVCLEIGEGQAHAVEHLLSDAGMRPLTRRRDLARIDRCLLADRLC